MNQPTQILVCAACRTEACFDGVLMCEEAYTAGVATLVTPPLPLGFRHISVIVTAAELRGLTREAALLGSGEVGCALRKRAGLPEEAHGLKAAVKRQNRKD